jgi:hypothetical protein
MISNLQPLPRQRGGDYWVSVLSAFNLFSPDEGGYSLQFILNVEPDRESGVYRLQLFAYDWMSITAIAIPYAPGAPDFAFDRWTNIRVDVKADGQIQLHQDDIIVAQGKLPSNAQKHVQLRGFHALLYGKFDQGVFYNAPIEVKLW